MDRPPILAQTQKVSVTKSALRPLGLRQTLRSSRHDDEKGAATAVELERYYFKVPFLKKDRAKAMGMRFDGARKLWLAPNSALASDAAKTFEKIDELRDDNDVRAEAQRSI